MPNPNPIPLSRPSGAASTSGLFGPCLPSTTFFSLSLSANSGLGNSKNILDVSTYAGLGFPIVLLSNHAVTLPNVDRLPALSVLIGNFSFCCFWADGRRDA
jgi:hypothetical protein